MTMWKSEIRLLERANMEKYSNTSSEPTILVETQTHEETNQHYVEDRRHLNTAQSVKPQNYN